MSILSVSDISKSYDKKKLAVENLSFELNEGDFFGFLGPNVLINDGYCYFCEPSSGNTVLVVQC